MSFAQKYIDLIEKYSLKVEAIKALSVTEAFGVPILQPESATQLVYDLNYIRDYHDERDYPCIYTEDGEEHCAYDLGYNSYECAWDVNLNEAFTAYVLEAFEKETPKEILLQAVETDRELRLLLGGFYMSITDNLYYESSKDYSALKKEYPNEKYYPNLSLNTDDITHFESSKCW